MQVFGCLFLLHHHRRRRSELPCVYPHSLCTVALRQMSPSSCTVQLIHHRAADKASVTSLSSCMVRLFLSSLFLSPAPAGAKAEDHLRFRRDSWPPCGPTRHRKPPALRTFHAVPSRPVRRVCPRPTRATFSSVLVPTMARVGEPSANLPRGPEICMHRTAHRGVVPAAAPNAVTNAQEPVDTCLRQSDRARQRHAPKMGPRLAQCPRSQDSLAVVHIRPGSWTCSAAQGSPVGQSGARGGKPRESWTAD